MTFVKKSYRKGTLLLSYLELSGVRFIFLIHGDVSQDDLWSMLKEMEDVVIYLRRRHHTSRIVIGSDLNVSLAPSLEGLTGSRIHSNANGAPSSLALSCDRVDALPSFTCSVYF